MPSKLPNLHGTSNDNWSLHSDIMKESSFSGREKRDMNAGTEV